MIVEKVWYKKVHWDEPKYKYKGWFLFGIIPLFIKSYGVNY